MVHLSRLHVHVINVVPFDILINSILFVVFVHIIEELVTLSEFVYHKFLKLNHINNIKESFYLVKHHDTELIGYAAVAVFSHNH